MLVHGGYYCNLHSMRSWFKRNAPHCHLDRNKGSFPSSGSTQMTEEGGQGDSQSAAAFITDRSTLPSPCGSASRFS